MSLVVTKVLMVLQEPCSVQYSRSEQEAKQSQQDVYNVGEVQSPTQSPSARASGRGLRVPEEGPSVSTPLVIVVGNQPQQHCPNGGRLSLSGLTCRFIRRTWTT